MIKDMVGSSEAGIYSYIYTICTILYIVGNSMENAWSPWVFYTLDSGDKKRIERAGKDYVMVFVIVNDRLLLCDARSDKDNGGK